VISAALSDALAGRKRILLAGAGGGYDILGAVPLTAASTPSCAATKARSLYWFFSLPVVGNTHLFLDSVRDTESIWDVSARVEGARKVIGVRSRTGIPI